MTDRVIPEEHKQIALRLLSIEQLRAALQNPTVSDENKLTVQLELNRRERDQRG